MPTLVEKICAAVAGADTVLKEGDNGQYAYLRILDSANVLREKLFAAGVLVLPSDVECVVERRESAITDRQYTEATVKTRFTLTDGAGPSLEFYAFGFARDLDAKCVAVAQTAALKSFLKRLAMIFGNLDDPEVEQPSEHSLNLEEGEKEWGWDVREWPISRGEVIAFNSACQASGYGKKGIANYLDSNFGVEVPSNLKRKHLPQAMAWATASGEKPVEAAGNEPT